MPHTTTCPVCYYGRMTSRSRTEGEYLVTETRCSHCNYAECLRQVQRRFAPRPGGMEARA